MYQYIKIISQYLCVVCKSLYKFYFESYDYRAYDFTFKTRISERDLVSSHRTNIIFEEHEDAVNIPITQYATHMHTRLGWVRLGLGIS